ncbi:MAG: hypothetical protein SGI91_08490 [Alphaproteobacteria bacterium]|jgi:hypothetical protein|nr:hypothetical protein [Alphaproteobacteria bacterium]
MPHRLLTRDELIQHIAIRMAATDRNPPLLRGKASPRDASERDRFRHDFAAWFVQVCIEECGLMVIDYRAPPVAGSDMAGITAVLRPLGTPPQRLSL